MVEPVDTDWETRVRASFAAQRVMTHLGATLMDDFRATIARFDTATDGSMRVPSDYAEVVVTRA